MDKQKIIEIVTFENTNNTDNSNLMRKLRICFPLLLFIYTSIHSQVSPTMKKGDLVQLSGRLLDELLQPLPYSHILVLNNYRGAITDKSGKFSFVAGVKDSVLFSSLGFKKKILVVPDTLNEPFMNFDIVLDRDTFLIGEVEIYPWKSYEEFKQAFLSLKLPDDDMDRARKNIALIKTQIILDETPNSRQNFQKILEEQYRETYTRGAYPTYQILNAFAWKEFFEALKRGDFKKYSERDE